MATVVASWIAGINHFRFVEDDSKADWDVSKFALECLERDAAGGDKWVRVELPNGTTGGVALREGVRKLGHQLRALRDTMDYSKGARQG